jgi:hypothetical protein
MSAVKVGTLSAAGSSPAPLDTPEKHVTFAIPTIAAVNAQISALLSSPNLAKFLFIGILALLVLLFTVDSLTTNYSFTVLAIFFAKVNNFNLIWLTVVLTFATAFCLIICFPVIVLAMATGFVMSARMGFFAGVAVGIPARRIM